jgi:hypothetical protein
MTCLVAIVFSTLFAIMAYSVGQDGNWDFYNHHFYNAHSFMNDRFWFDIQAGQRQNYFSPFLDIPFYVLTQAFGTLIASLFYAVFQSWQAPAIFILSYLLLRSLDLRFPAALAIAVCLTVLAVLTPLNFLLVGTTTGDNSTATIVLAGLSCFVLALSRIHRSPPVKWNWVLFASAGILTGLAVGLKLTNGPFAVALAVCGLLVPGDFRLKFKVVLVLGFSSFAGLLLGYGYWGWFLYQEFQNPVFPEFNHIFQSDYMKHVHLTDKTFKVTILSGRFLYPFFYNLFTGTMNHQQFLDLRIPLLYIMMVGICATLIVSPSVRKRCTNHPVSSGILLFCGVSYLVWLHLFSSTRYLVVLEVLVPAAIVAASFLIFRRKRVAAALASVLILAVTATTVVAVKKGHAFGLRTPWGNSPFQVRFPDFELADSMVLVSGGQAMSFIIPSAPESTRFVRIDSNLNYVGYTSLEDRYSNEMGRRLSKAIAGHQRAFFIISTDNEEAFADDDLNYFGLKRNTESCSSIESNGPPLIMCRAERLMTNGG